MDAQLELDQAVKVNEGDVWRMYAKADLGRVWALLAAALRRKFALPHDLMLLLQQQASVFGRLVKRVLTVHNVILLGLRTRNTYLSFTRHGDSAFVSGTSLLNRVCK